MLFRFLPETVILPVRQFYASPTSPSPHDLFPPRGERAVSCSFPPHVRCGGGCGNDGARAVLCQNLSASVDRLEDVLSLTKPGDSLIMMVLLVRWSLASPAQVGFRKAWDMPIRVIGFLPFLPRQSFRFAVPDALPPKAAARNPHSSFPVQAFWCERGYGLQGTNRRKRGSA